ncbi:DUF1573 domain-containing protein [Pontibacter sp. G13]|uniref:DUF1573 domain-containing protein n=1 Tax=Pontibacter sp. G13 TaxID=3074898 RepID=UPI00288B67DC|nr:DUF1573 domain-containing protein [Pontibacter sp. G13]WNJ18813.1 DUF1573 domain-containing protein [Pontibacter sp. G13]
MQARIIATWTLVLFAWTSVFAQVQDAPKKLQFDKTTHQFGQLDKGDPAEHTFVFTNQSEEPVTLTRVKASCGCTTPKWSKEPIAPGKTGEIQVKYNSQRVGKFTKSITVTYDSVERPIVLYIKGEVLNPQADPSMNYPQKQGNMGFDKISQNVGVLDSDKSKSLTFKFRNNGALPITFKQTMDPTMRMEVRPSATTIIPGGIGTITVVVRGEKFDKQGPFSQAITLATNDADQPNKIITVSGSINMVMTAEELAAQPNIQFDVLEYDGGSVIEGEKVQVKYTFTNTGKDDLVLETVRASCGCTATAPKDKVIPGGATSEIVATFDSRGRSGKQQKTITVKSNDPDQPNVLLKLKVYVEKDPFHTGAVGPTSSNR